MSDDASPGDAFFTVRIEPHSPSQRVLEGLFRAAFAKLGAPGCLSWIPIRLYRLALPLSVEVVVDRSGQAYTIGLPWLARTVAGRLLHLAPTEGMRWNVRGRELIGEGPTSPRRVLPALEPSATLASFVAEPVPDEHDYAVRTAFDGAMARARRQELHLLDLTDRSADVLWEVRLADEADAAVVNERLDHELQAELARADLRGVRIEGEATLSGVRLTGAHTLRADRDWGAILAEVAQSVSEDEGATS